MKLNDIIKLLVIVAPVVETFVTTDGLDSSTLVERRATYMFYTYVLRSIKDNKLYIGSTSDLKTRYKFHNQGRVRATKARRPFILIYYEACLNKLKAEKREKYFKTGFGRGFLKNRI